MLQKQSVVRWQTAVTEQNSTTGEQGRQRPRFLAGGLRRGAPGRWKRRREIAEREELEK